MAIRLASPLWDVLIMIPTLMLEQMIFSRKTVLAYSRTPMHVAVDQPNVVVG